MSAARFDDAARSPLMILGIAVFIDYVFACWPFRKLYMEVPEFNYGQFRSGVGHWFDIEGRLRDHIFLADRYWDQILLALYRETWAREGAPVLRLERVTGP